MNGLMKWILQECSEHININIDITFRILVGVAIGIYGCAMAYLTSNPTDWFGYVALGAIMVLCGSKAVSNIKTPWFSIGNGDAPVLPPNDPKEASKQ